MAAAIGFEACCALTIKSVGFATGGAGMIEHTVMLKIDSIKRPVFLPLDWVLDTDDKITYSVGILRRKHMLTHSMYCTDQVSTSPSIIQCNGTAHLQIWFWRRRWSLQSSQPVWGLRGRGCQHRELWGSSEAA